MMLQLEKETEAQKNHQHGRLPTQESVLSGCSSTHDAGNTDRLASLPQFFFPGIG